MLFLSSSKVRAKAKKNKKRQGLRETLIMHCLICKSNVHTFETSENVQSEKGNRMKDINLRSAAATLSMGGGLTKLCRLCNDLNLPQPINEKPSNNYISYLKTCAVENCKGRPRAAARYES